VNPLRTVIALALTCTLWSCLQVDHFVDEPSSYDNVYFGAQAPLEPQIDEDQWRLYAVLGLVGWNQDQLEFAGNYLSKIDTDQRPTNVHIITELTFLNALANIGVSLIPLGSLFLVTRSTQVIGWSDPSSGS